MAETRKPVQKTAEDQVERTEPRRTVSVDTAEAHADRVAMVSRDKNGNPDQAAGYEIIVPDDEKDRAENKPADNQVDNA